MPMQARIGGTWQQMTGARAFVSGSWRTIMAIKAFVGGDWRDVANFTPAGSGGGGSGSMTLTLDQSSLSRSTTLSAATTTPVTATPSGGLAPYTYAWTRVSGDSRILITNPVLARTSFKTSGLGAPETRTAVFRCTCTDSLSVTASADVTVSISRTL